MVQGKVPSRAAGWWWFEVRFQESFKVSQGSARSGAALRFHRVPHNSARISQQGSNKRSRNVLQGSVVCPGGKQCVVRPPSLKPSEQ